MSGPEPIFFASPHEFYEWLEEHHETGSEVYVGFYKAHTGRRGMSWSEAVDQALCFGWIDGRGNRDINVAKVAKLKEAGRMRPAGLAAFERR